MKKERGITLVSLLIYVMAFSMILILLGVLTNYLYPKLSGVNSNGASAEEFNKFNTYFVTDIKQSKIAKVNKSGDNVEILLSNGANYNFIKENIEGKKENAIYRNNIKISKNVTAFTAELIENVGKDNKTVIKINVGTGKDEENNPVFEKTINYVLRYW